MTTALSILAVLAASSALGYAMGRYWRGEHHRSPRFGPPRESKRGGFVRPESTNKGD